ncbi:hypothetical protein [Soonwooa sp.]|uniref:hypothetical protein n=1 Tax=Soonwooa sp. TaxID=1938592 RepID=UPI00260EE51F|nr:hypothetical protein [Soonwooa sp.]
MKTSKLDYFNIFLAIALGFILILNLMVRYKNKEQDKLLWGAYILSSNADSSKDDVNAIKIIDASFSNRFDKSQKSLNYDSKKEAGEIVNTVDSVKIKFSTYNEDLLPDSLSVRFFSGNERKFYQLTTKLPYEKIRKLVLRNKQNPAFFIEIQNKGKVLLKLNQAKNDNLNYATIASFNAKETTGTIDELVNKESLDGHYNDYDGVTKISDFGELISNKYWWIAQIEKVNPEDKITSFYAISHAEYSIDDLQDDSKPALRSIPKEFYIDWKNNRKYSVVYELNSQEVLDAFRKLNQLNSPYPIMIKFRIDDNDFTRCYISRGDTSIELKDLYPSKP